MKKVIKSYRESINPPYCKKDMPAILGTLLVILALPVTLFLISQQQDLRQLAQSNSPVAFLDSAGNPTSQTTSATVNVELSSPFTGATPTTPPSQPTPTQMVMATPPPTSGGTNAKSFGIWKPKLQTTNGLGFNGQPYNGSNPLDSCTVAEHDSYKVQGPDGKWYPTWHLPQHTRADGTKCRFGHEHGRDPTGSQLWNQVKQYFAYDANANGTIDANELAAAGLPFGYVNEQLDIYNNGAIMRHENHEGHKVNWMNGEADTGEHFFGNSTTGGVVIPLQPNSGGPWQDSGAKCYHFDKFHQGTSSNDAFANNLHEVYYFTDCKGPTAAYDNQISMAVIARFGNVGEFVSRDLTCSNTTDIACPVIVGTNAQNANFPGGGGIRLIQDRLIVQKFLTPPGGFMGNGYEVWTADAELDRANWQPIAGGSVPGFGSMFGSLGGFELDNPIRYYWPGKPNDVGYYIDICYEVGPNGERAFGGQCGNVTPGLTYDDPRSPFKGTIRDMYVQPPGMYNAGGPSVWYTDPFGFKGQTTPFPGSIKQLVTPKNINYANLRTDVNIPPRVSNRIDFDDGTVHAPN